MKSNIKTKGEERGKKAIESRMVENRSTEMRNMVTKGPKRGDGRETENIKEE